MSLITNIFAVNNIMVFDLHRWPGYLTGDGSEGTRGPIPSEVSWLRDVMMMMLQIGFYKCFGEIVEYL